MINTLFNEPLKNHTTMKVGGEARIFLMPESSEEIFEAVEGLKASGLPFYVLGGGSNLIFSDSGFKGAVVCTEKIDEITRADGGEINLLCGAGAKTSDISKWCEENLISGFETFAGLPGTIGGAVFMNARCYNDEISNHIRAVEYLDLDKMSFGTYDFDRNDWEYKKSPFQDGKKLVTSVVLCGFEKLEKNSDEAKMSAEKASGFVKDREAKGHFKYPSAGSVFKNNHDFGKPSGAIIDECGLKGLACGGAQIAPWHGNFIINNGDATSGNIKSLVETVQKTVKEKKGFDLEPEIIFVE